MGALNHQANRRSDAGIKAENLIGLIRPEVVAGSDVPGKATGPAELLRLGGVSLDPLQTIFGLFSILDVGVGAVPSDDYSCLVAQSFGTEQKPAVGSIGAAHARLDVTGRSGLQHFFPDVLQPGSIVGVNRRLPFRAKRPLHGEARIIEPTPVEILCKAVSLGTPRQCRDRVKRKPQLSLGVGELGFALTQGDLRPLAIFDVVGGCVPGDYPFIPAERHASCNEPAVFAIGPAKAQFGLEGFACHQRNIPGGFEPWNIFGVRYDADAARPLCGHPPAVVTADLVDEVDCAVGTMPKDHDGNRIDHEPKLALGTCY